MPASAGWCGSCATRFASGSCPDRPTSSPCRKVYRIVPADTPPGRAELDDINTLKVRNGEAPFASFEEVVDAVRADEHPAIRFQELL